MAEPSPADMADTITGTYRILRLHSTQLNQLFGMIYALQLLLSAGLMFLAVYLLARKLRNV